MNHRPSAGRLRPFRLEEVPLDVRLRAANHARVRELPDDNTDPRDRLFAVLAEAAAIDSTEDAEERARLLRAAHAPSDRIYWIRAAKWDEVMGDDAWSKVMGS
jgi:hypothetical protein